MGQGGGLIMGGDQKRLRRERRMMEAQEALAVAYAEAKVLLDAARIEPVFGQRILAKILSQSLEGQGRFVDAGKVRRYREALHEARMAEVAMAQSEKHSRVNVVIADRPKVIVGLP